MTKTFIYSDLHYLKDCCDLQQPSLLTPEFQAELVSKGIMRETQRGFAVNRERLTAALDAAWAAWPVRGAL